MSEENTYFDLDPKVKGSRSHKTLPSTIYIVKCVTYMYAPEKFEVAMPTV